MQSVVHRYSPTTTRQRLDAALETRQDLVGRAELLAAYRESKEAALTDRCHLAFGGVDLQS